MTANNVADLERKVIRLAEEVRRLRAAAKKSENEMGANPQSTGTSIVGDAPPRVPPGMMPASAAETGTIKDQLSNLNSGTARSAIILSEIIGPPVSKRRRRKWR